MRKIRDTRYLRVHFKFLNCSSMRRQDTGRSSPAPSPWFALIYVNGRKSNTKDGLDMAEHCLISDMFSLQPNQITPSHLPTDSRMQEELMLYIKIFKPWTAKAHLGSKGPLNHHVPWVEDYFLKWCFLSALGSLLQSALVLKK